MKTETTAINIDRGKGDFSYPEAHVRDAGAGLSERTVHYISDVKEDPDWVREFRLRGLKTFLEKPLPTHWASKDLDETAHPAVAVTQPTIFPLASAADHQEGGGDSKGSACLCTCAGIDADRR